MVSLVQFGDIRLAARRLHRAAHRTPVFRSRTLDALTGARVFLKAENLQRAGAFKFRGAYNAMSLLPTAVRKHGVLAYSSGNHAQAVALAGRELGIATTIIMPTDAPAVKLEATCGYGAEVIPYDREEITREALAARLAADRGLEIIPPYDHPHVIAGQGTAAVELIEDHGPLDLLLAPCGGGGLLSGTAVASKHLHPPGRIIGVEPASADDAARSFHTGTLHSVDNPNTIADGARTPSLGEVTFPLILEHVDDIVTVDDEAILRAMRFSWQRLKLVVEPTGALALAALLETVVDARGASVGVILSGGNVDLASFGFPGA